MEPETPRQHRRAYTIALVCICCALLGGAIFFAYQRTHSTEQTVETVHQTTNHEAFDDVRLEARAALVYDVRNNTVLYSKNGDTTLPLASLTKIMTALVAMTDIPAEHEVVISGSALQTDGDSGLVAGERWSVFDLTSFMLVISSNDGATALREAYESVTGGSFIAAMNNRADKLGLTNTTFVNESGLDEGWGKETNAGSARDVAQLLAHATRRLPELFEDTRHETVVFTSLSGQTHTAPNTNLLINDIPWSVGAKTGFTDSAGGNLAIMFDASVGRPIVIVVMGSSRDGRFTDAQKLIKATLRSTKKDVILRM